MTHSFAEKLGRYATLPRILVHEPQFQIQVFPTTERLVFTVPSARHEFKETPDISFLMKRLGSVTILLRLDFGSLTELFDRFHEEFADNKFGTRCSNATAQGQVKDQGH